MKTKQNKLWSGESVYCVCGHHIENHHYDGCIIMFNETRELRHKFWFGKSKGYCLTSEGWRCSCRAFMAYDFEKKKKRLSLQPESKKKGPTVYLSDLFPSN